MGISGFYFNQNSKSETECDEREHKKNSNYKAEVEAILKDYTGNPVNARFVQDSFPDNTLQGDGLQTGHKDSTNYTSNLSSDENSLENPAESVESVSNLESKKHYNRPNEGREEILLKEDYSCINRKRINQDENVYFMFKKNEFPHNVYFACLESFESAFGNESVWIFPISYVSEGVFYQDNPRKRIKILNAFKKSVLFRDKSK